MPYRPWHITPLVVLFAILVAALLVARAKLVPETFGDLGFYRAQALDDAAELEISYAGMNACFECHDDVFEDKSGSHHDGLSCEACHGPAALHVEEPDEYTPTAPRGRGYCILCHGYNPSRPSGFPQILPEQHNPGKVCMSCHEPHNPLLPNTPEECSACHRDIANVKLVSHHTSLACTVCHEVQPEHMTDPHYAHAEKPTGAETCAKCHAEGAESSEKIPRVNIEEHTQRYLCWDCHYPHYPEAK